jgi:hypothetical protein
MTKEERETLRDDEKSLLENRLREEESEDLAEILADCGRELKLICVNCGTHRSAKIRCKKRWCPVCAYYVAVDRVQKYREAVSHFQWPLFVTLTVPNTPDVEGLVRLKESWGKFRRRKLIRDRVVSGVVGYEVTNKGKGWHPHIHALLDCRWLSIHIPEPTRRDNVEQKMQKCKLAAEELGRIWSDCCGVEHSSVLARRGDSDALIEVLKYSCKGSELIACDDRITPLIRLMQGMRLMTTFGEIRKRIQDEDLEKEEGDTGCQCEKCKMFKTTIPLTAAQFLMRK